MSYLVTVKRHYIAEEKRKSLSHALASIWGKRKASSNNARALDGALCNTHWSTNDRAGRAL